MQQKKTQASENEFLSSVQDVTSFVTEYLRGISIEFEDHQVDSVKLSNGQTKYSGRVSFRELQSFTDAKRQVARECFLHLGFAAFGSVRAVATAASVRQEIWSKLNKALPSGALTEAGPYFTVTMSDGVFRLKSTADGARAALHVRAQFSPAFIAQL